MTNREWLESLTDKKWAKVVSKLDGDGCIFCAYNALGNCYEKDCEQGHVDWLKAEHEERDNGHRERRH